MDWRRTRLRAFTLFGPVYFLFSATLTAQQAVPPGVFKPPVDFQILLSANFGEIRSDHFHSGIDIKTQGAEGKPIIACADGFISRINVSPGGFGHALYINHPNGFVTVYGHLQSFRKDIEVYVRAQQYRLKSFAVNLFPEMSQFQVRQGDLIGLSGNTGSSSGPHLHLEVRKESSQLPVDPLMFFEVRDDIPPEFRNIYIYDMGHGSPPAKRKFPVIKQNGSLSLGNQKGPVEVSTHTGIGVEAFDYLSYSNNRCGIQRIQVFLDEAQVYENRMDEFSFAETRYVNSHIDYEEKKRSGVIINRTFLEPNNRLSTYKNVYNRGILQLPDTLPHSVRIVVSDSHRNSSQVSFLIRRRNGMMPVVRSERKEEYTRVFPYQSANQYEAEGFSIDIPAFALYDSLYFRYARTPATRATLSPVHHVHDRFTAVHDYFQLAIRPDPGYQAPPSRLLIVMVDDSGKLTPCGGTYRNGYVEARIRGFGMYAVAADTIPPVITPLNFNSKSGPGTLSGLRFRVTDNLSGIKSYHGYIDNQWVLFEHDPKTESLYYKFDPSRIEKGKQHKLVLTVIDDRENYSVFSRDFYW